MNSENRESLRVARPGRMTALMQAVSTGPKVLRIGVVRAGRVVEERILKQRAPVTIGWNEGSTFVIADPKAPVSLRLFEFTSGTYFLNTSAAMSGRVVTPEGPFDLGAARRIRLGDDARGKVVIGDVAFLFQFVTAPPAQPKPQLPVSIVRGNGIDWRTTVIAAFSFMVHFGAIGALYSDWFDRPVDYDIVVSNVLESMPPFVPMTEPETPVETTASESTQSTKGEPTKSKGTGENMPRSNVASLSNAIDRLQMSVLGVLSSSGATADVLRSGEVPTSLLDEAAKRNSGVGGPGLAVAVGGPLKPGASGPGFSTIGDTHAGGGGGTGTATVQKGPRGSIIAPPPDLRGAHVANAASVIAGLKGGFRRCYERALADDPDQTGRIDLSIKVGLGGEVQSVTATPRGNLSSLVVACVRGKAQGAQFEPPQGGLAIVQVPVSLVKQQ
jgi:hypothetical protein